MEVGDESEPGGSRPLPCHSGGPVRILLQRSPTCQRDVSAAWRAACQWPVSNTQHGVSLHLGLVFFSKPPHFQNKVSAILSRTSGPETELQEHQEQSWLVALANHAGETPQGFILFWKETSHIRDQLFISIRLQVHEYSAFTFLPGS